MYKTVSLMAIIICFITNVVQGQGCMEAKSEEGVTIAGYIQPQFEYKENGDEVSFTFNRARIGLLGNIPYDISYYLFVEASPFKTGAPYLLDGFISYTRLWPHAKISIGQFKSPFSLEQNTSCADLYTINRSQVVTQLASPQRDLGLLITGGRDTSLVKYSIALMNGTGRGIPDNNKKKDIVGRLVLSPTKFIDIGGSYRYGLSKPLVKDSIEDKRIRYGGEIQLKYKEFLLQSEYIFGKDIGSTAKYDGCGNMTELRKGTFKKNGYFIQAMYMFHWKHGDIQPVIKYESWEPDMDEVLDIERITTFGLNYFLNDWTRVQINYLYCAEESYYTEVKNDQILIQVQVKF